MRIRYKNPLLEVLAQVRAERRAQDAKWGEQNHPDGTGGSYLQLRAQDAREKCGAAFQNDIGTWMHILEEEVAEAFAETDATKLRTELLQVAAVAVAWVEAIDRSRGTR